MEEVGESVPGRGHSMCKGPEGGASWCVQGTGTWLVGLKQ